MHKLVRLCSLSLLLGACGSDGIGTPLIPGGPEVSASLLAVSLAEDCASSSGFADQGKCAEGAACPSLCQQSNLQLDLAAEGGSAAVAFEIVAVRVISESDAGVRDELTARRPLRWASTGYTDWDQQIAPDTALKVSYDLSAPDWAVLGGSTTRSSGAGQTYRVEVDVRINGVLRTLSRGGVTREPEVAT